MPAPIGETGLSSPTGSGPLPASPVGPLAATLLVSAFAAAATVPVGDIDYWWHIAAGRWIVEHGSIPTTDPFGVFGDANPVRTLTVLRGQWLGQVLLYLLHRAAGPSGAVALRVVALSAAVATVAFRARRSRAPWISTILAAALAAFGLLGFTGERPQLFSFALFGLVLFLIERAETGRLGVTVAATALLGLAWANLHASVLLGFAIVAGMALVDSAVRWRARQGPARLTYWLSALALGGAALMAPNGLRSLAYVLETQSSVLAQRTSEYVSSLSIGPLAGKAVQAGVAASLAAAAIALLPLLKRSPARAAALVALAGAGLISYRYHAFFLVGAGPWIAEGLGVLERRRLAPGGRRGPAAAGALAVAFAGLLLLQNRPLQALRAPVAPGRFPEAAMEHLRDVGAEGRALIWFDWSGYALWECAPGIVPFVDPRMLDDAMLRPYTHMIWATPEGLAALSAGGIRWVLLPHRSRAGEPYPLHRVLRSSPDWAVAYQWS